MTPWLPFTLAACLALSACSGPPPEVVRPSVTPPGGWWDVARWRGFLQAWSDEAIAVLRAAPRDRLTGKQREALARGTLLAAPADDRSLDALAFRLGRPLPPSYRAFQRASGGWLQVAMDVDDARLWAPAQAAWFRDQEPQWLAAWTRWSWARDPDDATYFVYGPGQDPVHLRRSYLPHALAISEGVESAIYLLNPLVRDDRGEWEAWWFGNALPGAQRHRSFQDLMAAERPRVIANLRAGLRPR